MQLWNTHNMFRAALVCADGHLVFWDYKKSLFTADHNSLVKETRTVDGLIRNHGEGNKRLAIDKIVIHGLRAFENLGFDIMNGEEIAEKARSIKNEDEIYEDCYK
jgi:Xaa-Pro dipeptidase